MDIKEQLLDLKEKQKFIYPDWDEDGELPTTIATNKKLNYEVNGFIDFLISLINESKARQIILIQAWFDDWDVERFSKGETESVADVMLLTLEMAQIKHDDILI